MSVQITGNVSVPEQQAYVEYLENKYHRRLKSLDIKADGEFAEQRKERRRKRPCKTRYINRIRTVITALASTCCQRRLMPI